eukprot:4707371-Prymnesium_polylepis.1
MRNNTDRGLAQPSAWAECFRHIHAAEREDERSFDVVVRARPDAYWAAPHPGVCGPPPMIVAESGFPEASADAMPHIPPVASATAFPGFVDRHFVLPRPAALPVMAGLARSYETCRGSLAVATLEQWLHRVLEQTAAAKGFPYRLLGFPFVLVRKDVNQPSVSCDFPQWLNI